MKSKNNSVSGVAGLMAAFTLFTSFGVVSAITPTTVNYSSNVLGDSVEGTPEPRSSEVPSTPKPPEINIQKGETEIQQGGQKIKIKTEDNGVTKVELEKPNVNLKFQLQNGALKLKSEDKSGAMVAATKQQEREVQDLLKKEDINVSTEDGRLKFEHNGQDVQTHFPLSIDPITKKLVVTTPEGQKTVSTLPDTAVENLISNRVISSVASIAGVPSMSLESRDGKTVYRVNGEKQAKVFGFIPVTLPTTAFVSADNGQVLAEERSLLTSILTFFSR